MSDQVATKSCIQVCKCLPTKQLREELGRILKSLIRFCFLFAKLVIRSSKLGVAQNLKCFTYALKLLRCSFGIIWILVGMILAQMSNCSYTDRPAHLDRRFSVRLFNLEWVCIRFDLKEIVILAQSTSNRHLYPVLAHLCLFYHLLRNALNQRWDEPRPRFQHKS